MNFTFFLSNSVKICFVLFQPVTVAAIVCLIKKKTTMKVEPFKIDEFSKPDKHGSKVNPSRPKPDSKLTPFRPKP